MSDAIPVETEVLSTPTPGGIAYGVLAVSHVEPGRVSATVHYGSRSEVVNSLFDDDMIGWNDLRAGADHTLYILATRG